MKPDFFDDEDLAEFPFWTRILYEGLWCYADKEGRLEDRPVKLKAKIFPYDKKVDVDRGLALLAEPKKHSPQHPPFIVRYEVKGERYIQILAWDRHQSPHHTEKDSEIPPFTGEIPVKAPVDKGATGDAHYQETKNNESDPKTKGDARGFEAFWKKYPRKLGKQDALAEWMKITSKEDPARLEKALDNYIAELGRNGTEAKFIKHPTTFLRKDRWKDYLELEAPAAGKADRVITPEEQAKADRMKAIMESSR